MVAASWRDWPPNRYSGGFGWGQKQCQSKPARLESFGPDLTRTSSSPNNCKDGLQRLTVSHLLARRPLCISEARNGRRCVPWIIKLERSPATASGFPFVKTNNCAIHFDHSDERAVYINCIVCIELTTTVRCRRMPKLPISSSSMSTSFLSLGSQ